jgi:hypothetical protein
MVTFFTTREINSYITSELGYDGKLAYVVEYVGDDGETVRAWFFDHASTYAFVRDEILEFSS